MNARVGISEDEAFGGRDRQVAQLRVPPHSTEAESSVLGGLLQDNRAWDVVGDMLADTDFYRHEHRLIFAAVAMLVNANKPADVVTVFEHLQRFGKHDEVGGLVYLNSLAQYVPSAANSRRYAEIVREHAMLRRLISTVDEIASKAFNTGGESVTSIIDQAEAKILAVAEGRGGEDEFKPMDFYVVKAIDRINRIIDDPEGEADFIPTGIGAWDDLLDGGMRGGELHVVAARPGHGKSAKLLTVAVNVASLQSPLQASVGDIGIFTMEMPGLQWANRAIAQVGKVHLSKIKRPERLRDADWPGITEGVELLKQMGIHINDRPARTINNVRSAARKLARRLAAEGKKLALLGVDYLGLMKGLDPRMLRTYQIEEITQGLKNLAKELGVPVMLLVQLKRTVDERADSMPTLADLRDSGAIEQDADVITFVHRPIKATPDLSEDWKCYARGFVAKARDSEGGLFDEHYEGPQLRFSDWPEGLEIPRDKTRVVRGSKPVKKDI
jgi:replicative DNA helicase